MDLVDFSRLEQLALNVNRSNYKAEVRRIRKMSLDTKINNICDLYDVEKVDVQEFIYLLSTKYNRLGKSDPITLAVKVADRYIRRFGDYKL